MDLCEGRLVAEGKIDEQINPSLPEISPQMQQFAACIQQAVRERTHQAIANLQVHIHAGEIILLGRCTTYYVKQLAQQAAMTAAGRQFLIRNEIDVELE